MVMIALVGVPCKKKGCGGRCEVNNIPIMNHPRTKQCPALSSLALVCTIGDQADKCWRRARAELGTLRTVLAGP